MPICQWYPSPANEAHEGVTKALWQVENFWCQENPIFSNQIWG